MKILSVFSFVVIFLVVLATSLETSSSKNVPCTTDKDCSPKYHCDVGGSRLMFMPLNNASARPPKTFVEEILNLLAASATITVIVNPGSIVIR